MNTDPKDDPGKKFRKLLGSSSPLTRLPKKSEIDAPIKEDVKENSTADVPSKQKSAAPVFKLPKIKPASFFKRKADSAPKSRILPSLALLYGTLRAFFLLPSM